MTVPQDWRCIKVAALALISLLVASAGLSACRERAGKKKNKSPHVAEKVEKKKADKKKDAASEKQEGNAASKPKGD